VNELLEPSLGSKPRVRTPLSLTRFLGELGSALPPPATHAEQFLLFGHAGSRGQSHQPTRLAATESARASLSLAKISRDWSRPPRTVCRR